MTGLALLTVLSPAHAAPIAINELYRAGNLGTTDEWVELVLTQDLTAAELDGFSVGDSTSATDAKFSGYGFTSMADFASVFLAGSVIVVGGTTGPASDLTYDPAGGDWTLILHTADPHLVSNGQTGDLAATDVVYVDTNGANGDQTLSTDGAAVCWDTTPGVFGALAQPIGVPANNTGAVLTGALGGAAWTTSTALAAMTPGQPNGGANTDAITLLRCVDTDGDGLCDDVDSCPLDYDPTDVDTDGDGLGDACDACLDLDDDGVCADLDSCPLDFDPTNADTDGDGLGDVCDDCLDLDGDGVCDDVDLCPLAADPGNGDADGDGLGDACDDCTDVDADTVCDAADLCPLDPDPTNADTDGDGLGDACDDCLDVDADAVCDDVDPCVSVPDTDGDGVCDDVDTCPADPDPSNLDTDGDGFGDVCDLPLSLVTDKMVPGAAWSATVTDALPGERVTLAVSPGPAGVGPCPSVLGGLCLDLGGAVQIIGVATADATGTASFATTLPAGLVPGRTYTFQAATVRGPAGVWSTKSNARQAIVQ